MSNHPFKFQGIMVWVTITGVMLVGLSILVIAVLEGEIIDRAGAHNREAAFVLLSQSVSTMMSQAGGIRDATALDRMVHEIVKIRPGILRLSIFDLTSESSPLLVSTDPNSTPKSLDPWEQEEIRAGRTVMRLEESKGERAWRIAAPITLEGKVVGALRGLFSVKEYDELIKQEIEAARAIGIAVIIITSSTFLLLIRVKVHRPVHQLVRAMRQVEGGDLSGRVPIQGPSDIQELAAQFNRMINRVRDVSAEKDQLLGEIRNFNETLQKRVIEATEELQRTNLELVETRLTVERSLRLAALGELAATVAHELGNPLNALSGHLQMLSHSEDLASRDRHLTVIRSEVDRMVAIIKQLLEQTRVPLRLAPVDLNATIHQVLAVLSLGLTKQQVVVKIDLQSDLPLVAGDPRALHGLIFNLATNAKQAMPSGGELRIRTQTTSGAELPAMVMIGDEGIRTSGKVVRLTIVDTGKGIPQEYLSKIFEPFFTTRRDEGGTGLGLAICHRVVTDSGGRLAVKSAVGFGTEFTVDLPIWNPSLDIRRTQ